MGRAHPDARREHGHVGGDVRTQRRPIHDHILKPTKYPALNTNTPRPATMAYHTDGSTGCMSLSADDGRHVAGADDTRVRQDDTRHGWTLTLTP